MGAYTERKGLGRIFASRAARPTPVRAESFTVLSVSEAWAKPYDFFFETQAIRLEHGLMYFETFSISTTSTSSFFEQESLKMTLTNY
jgi:hypothetical protein